ncbi:hypothetical protein G5714_021878 [Onychostoma macrolepis]|uniref:Ig-like domain-containing protein n=1 Tax=Onychostoma macrolepis TaxID=369639 RepID=A0A7J6BSA7_9TELE|nr:hypothetical protein G5714_021878 [Onychostoma macrolepis]
MRTRPTAFSQSCTVCQTSGRNTRERKTQDTKKVNYLKITMRNLKNKTERSLNGIFKWNSYDAFFKNKKCVKNQEGCVPSSPVEHIWYVITSLLLLYITGSFSDPVKVEGFVGDSADFSCSIPESEIQSKIEEFSVHWRDNEEKSVCDFIGGNRTCKDQAPEYKDRVETFPEEYKKGNFSIKLNHLQKTDARKYVCHITGPSQNYTTTELQVKDKSEGKGNHGELSLTVLFSCLLTSILLFI